MDATGFIEDVGVPSNVVKTPAVGLAVAKSGRTTGFTTGSVGSINTSVNVQYQRGCGKGKKFVIGYTNQVVVNGAGFSAGGDSGSLIVTNDTCHQPVALLYAGSSTSTIGNPVGEVLSKLGTQHGSALSFVGNTCGTALLTLDSAGSAGPTPNDIEVATTIKERHAADLMSDPRIVGVGVGIADQDPGRAAIVIYVDSTRPIRPRVPTDIEGVAVKIVPTDPIVAY